MKKYLPIFFIFTLLLSVVAVTSEAQSVPSIYPSSLTAYDIDQGLPISCANKIIIDNDGRLWLNPCPIYYADQDISAYQFDGNESFEIPIKKPDGDRDSSSWLFEGITRSGLLFGKNRRSDQAFLLDPETHKSRTYSFPPAERIINIVSNEENHIFALTRTYGSYVIYKLYPEEKIILTTIQKPEIKANYVLKEIPVFINNNTLWFLHQNKGFFGFDLNTKEVKEYSWDKLLGKDIPDYMEIVPYTEFVKMTKDRNGDLIFFLNELNSFFLFDTDSEQIIPYTLLNTQLERFTKDQLAKINFFPDAQENILIEIQYNRTPKEEEFNMVGYFVLLDNNEQLFNYNPVITQSVQTSRFNHDLIRDAYSVDFKKEAIIAISGGVIDVDIQADLSIMTPLGKWASRGMVQISEDIIWLKSDVKTIAEVDIKEGKASLFFPIDICNKDFLIPAFVQITNKDRQEIWFPTRDSALYSYKIKDQECTRFPVGVEFEKFYFINENEIALVSKKNILYTYNLPERKLSPFLQNGVPLNIGNVANEIYCDQSGIIWIAAQSGLWRVDPQSGNATRLGKADGFGDDQFMCIHETEDGHLWLGTFFGGLQYYHPQSGRIKIINENDGLSNNTVVGILADQEGDIWVSTFDGITVLSKDGKVLFELQEKDGLSHREFNRYSYLKTWDGQLIFGAIYGINIIDPVKVKQVYGQPEDLQIYLTKISFFNKKAKKVVVQRSNFEKITPIRLPPTHRYINLDFALSDYMNPEKMNFSYRIEKPGGLSKQTFDEESFWINIGPNTELTLTDLPVGEFTIFIKGSDYKGYWTEQPLAIPIKVYPFFYQTWWFYLLCSLPFIIGAYFWYSRLTTEKKRLEAEVNKRTLQIVKDKELIEEQAAKLLELDEMKSRFFTNISHEFRTPLTIISGMIPQITKQPDKWMTKGMELIQRNSNHLLSLINQILDLRKLESGALQANFIQADIIPYLNYIADSFRTVALAKGIKLHILSQKKELIMDYDPDKMMHILSNLLSNALKYTSTEEDIYFQINQTQDDQLQLIVKDTGQGIQKEHLPYIFDRFYQVEDLANQKPQGSGVGLALTKELVHLLNGVIEVDSEWGVGTTFSLFFPITRKARFQEQQSKLGPMSNEEMAGEESGTTVSSIEKTSTTLPIINNHPSKLESLPSLLIVEDNPEVRLYLTACLAENYDLLMAENGQEGIDAAIEKVPDLIVSDVMMPIKDGFELCDTLKNDERTSHIPIILLTAKADFDSKLSGLRKGADAYLTKPFQEEELLVRLEQLLILRNRLHERYKNQLGSASISPSAEHAMEDAFIGKFRQLVMDNITEEHFGVVQLCRSLGISRSQLHKKVKALTGLSTTSLVRSIRLHKAKQLLQTTDLNVSEVGYEVGINNPAYFSRIYSEEFGKAPRETRK